MCYRKIFYGNMISKNVLWKCVIEKSSMKMCYRKMFYGKLLLRNVVIEKYSIENLYRKIVIEKCFWENCY